MPTTTLWVDQYFLNDRGHTRYQGRTVAAEKAASLNQQEVANCPCNACPDRQTCQVECPAYTCYVNTGPKQRWQARQKKG